MTDQPDLQQSAPASQEPAVDPDTDFLPFGDRYLDQIAERVHDLGDDAENLGLEAKSLVDLKKPAGRSKVAKFILGMANRPSDLAARHFKGYGVMVLGVSKGAVAGIMNPPEEHQLRDALRKYLGPQQPQWRLVTRSVADGRSCVFIIVDPPKANDPVYICHGAYQSEDSRDKDGLRDGAIYIRDSTQTREAKAHEIQALIARQQRTGPAVCLTVTATGTAARIVGSERVRDRLIDAHADDLKTADAAQDRSPDAEFKRQILLGSSYVPPQERIPLEELITRDTTVAHENWPECLNNLVTGLAPRVRLHVVNDASGYLQDPELTLTIPGARCHEATPSDDLGWNDITPWPHPLPSQAMYVPPPSMKFSRATLGECPTDWTDGSDPCVITLQPKGLPPRTTRTASVDLVLESLDPDQDVLQCSWALVAANVPEQITGTLYIPVDVVETLELFHRWFENRSAAQG